MRYYVWKGKLLEDYTKEELIAIIEEMMRIREDEIVKDQRSLRMDELKKS